jgi:tRNA modification GTPase
MTDSTIAAVASPPGVGAIGLIRMSGPAAIAISDKVFRGKTRPSRARNRSVLLGEILDREGSPIDQVLLIIMRGPRSLTGEDVVEITCHGGNIAPRLVLRRLVEEGACPAEAGEFTKRAFLNGKIDLAQAEAVSEMVNASSEKALRIAMRQLKGDLSERLGRVEGALLDRLIVIEANIDFVDEEIEPLDKQCLARDLESTGSEIQGLLASHEQGKYIKLGLDVVIVGKPNVGKSSLFNRLIGKDRVIVSEIPGTTRDVVDGLVGVNGMVLRLHDTAGLGADSGLIEAEAVRRTRCRLEDADITLIVLDVSQPLTDGDLDIVGEVGVKPHLVVANKTDLPKKADLGRFDRPLNVSALKGWGMPELLDGLKQAAHAKMGDLDYEIVVGERHAACLREALGAIANATSSNENAVPPEFIASDIRCALDWIGEITGRKVSSRVLDGIFSRFCIGK